MKPKKVIPTPKPHCPTCGYTAEDAAKWLDHERCTGTIPGNRAPDNGKRYSKEPQYEGQKPSHYLNAVAMYLAWDGRMRATPPANERAIKASERCKLLQDVPDKVFEDAMRMLERMRIQHPQYRDDELLLKCLCAAFIREAEVVQDRMRGR